MTEIFRTIVALVREGVHAELFFGNEVDMHDKMKEIIREALGRDMCRMDHNDLDKVLAVARSYRDCNVRLMDEYKERLQK